MHRRVFIRLFSSALLLNGRPTIAAAQAEAKSSPANLMTLPIEVGGSWAGSPPDAAMRVIARMRDACLAGVKLLSDRQPDRLRIDNHASAPPSIWRHTDPPREAWVIVDIGTRAWSQLAYQFGHELGHVLCNSWQFDAVAPPPCRWLEEALAEAFSIRGLGLLAASWERDPPFAGNANYGQAIRDYRQNLISHYGGEGTRLDPWFREHRREIEEAQGVGVNLGPAIVDIASAIETAPDMVVDLGAVNRWPGRTALPLDDYLANWDASCREIGAAGLLPPWFRTVLGSG